MNKTEPKIESPLEFKDFVYCGKRWSTKNSMFVVIRIVLEDGTISDKENYYDYKRTRDKVIGGIYRGAKFSETSASGLDDTKYMGSWDDCEAITMWQAKDSYAETAKKTVQFEKDAKRLTELEKILTPLRSQYEAMRKNYDLEGCEVLEKAVLRTLKTPLRSIEK